MKQILPKRFLSNESYIVLIKRLRFFLPLTRNDIFRMLNEVKKFLNQRMDFKGLQLDQIVKNHQEITESTSGEFVSIETEIPEALYNGMKDFINDHPQIDQYGLMSSALANFLYQNGCSDRAVTERYLNDLFSLSEV